MYEETTTAPAEVETPKTVEERLETIEIKVDTILGIMQEVAVFVNDAKSMFDELETSPMGNMLKNMLGLR